MLITGYVQKIYPHVPLNIQTFLTDPGTVERPTQNIAETKYLSPLSPCTCMWYRVYKCGAFTLKLRGMGWLIIKDDVLLLLGPSTVSDRESESNVANILVLLFTSSNAKHKRIVCFRNRSVWKDTSKPSTDNQTVTNKRLAKSQCFCESELSVKCWHLPVKISISPFLIITDQLWKNRTIDRTSFTLDTKRSLK